VKDSGLLALTALLLCTGSSAAADGDTFSPRALPLSVSEHEDAGAALIREDRETGFFWPEAPDENDESAPRTLPTRGDPLRRFGENRDSPGDSLRRWEPDGWRSTGDGLRRWPQHDLENEGLMDGRGENP
jgi:hypothetical protein